MAFSGLKSYNHLGGLLPAGAGAALCDRGQQRAGRYMCVAGHENCQLIKDPCHLLSNDT